MPKRGEVGFPILIMKENEDRSVILRDILGAVFLIYFFWNITLVVGIMAGNSMTNHLTGIDSLFGTPARLLLQVMVK